MQIEFNAASYMLAITAERNVLPLLFLMRSFQVSLPPGVMLSRKVSATISIES